MIDAKNILDIAKREWKGDATEEEQDWLNAPENRRMWAQALVQAMSDFESQMIYHRDRIKLQASDAQLGFIDMDKYQEEKDKFDAWQRKALRFRTGINERLSQVKALIGDDPNVNNLDEITRLTRAIIQHHRSALEADLSPEIHDEKLWAHVNLKA